MLLPRTQERMSRRFSFRNLIDQWLIYMAPVMLGSDARPTHHAVFNSLGQANRYSISAHDLIGDDLRIIMRQVAKG